MKWIRGFLLETFLVLVLAMILFLWVEGIISFDFVKEAFR